MLRRGSWTSVTRFGRSTCSMVHGPSRSRIAFSLPRTVHVIVVDPGVGSARRPIIAETDDYIFVAPDNGVLSLVEAREPRFIVRHITAERYFLQPVSQTFHGRDIFSPVAGWLSKGVAPPEFGPEISDYVRLPLPAVEHVSANKLLGIVLKVDKFGNLITNCGSRNSRSFSPPRRLTSRLWSRAGALLACAVPTRRAARRTCSPSSAVRVIWRSPRDKRRRRRSCQRSGRRRRRSDRRNSVAATGSSALPARNAPFRPSI